MANSLPALRRRLLDDLRKQQSARRWRGCRYPESRASSGALAHFSSNASGESSNFAFDRRLKLLHRDGTARAHNCWLASSEAELDEDDAIDYDYFRREIATRLVDRLDDIKREDGFPLALDIGTWWNVAF